MDDVNDMDESMDKVGPSAGAAENALRDGVDRRTMLKAAVAAGTIAGTWIAPRIESLGFAPAGAATPCVVLSVRGDDKNSSGQSFCPTNPNNTPPRPCCGRAFGNSGQKDTFTFSNPGGVGCATIVVRTISLTCDTTTSPPPSDQNNENPDEGQFAVIIESTSGEAACNQCQIFDAVIIDSSGRKPMTVAQLGGASPFRNNGPIDCGGPGVVGTGVDASVFHPVTGMCTTIDNDARLAVRLTCNISGTCPPPPF